MASDYAAYSRQYSFLFVEDALYADSPHVKDLEDKGYNYILNVRPDSHKTLFAQVAGKEQRKQLKTYSLEQNGLTHHFCNTHAHQRVNFLRYQQSDKASKTTTFTWIINIPIDQRRPGRS